MSSKLAWGQPAQFYTHIKIWVDISVLFVIHWVDVSAFGNTDWFKITKGVRQGCILTPAHFNLYAESIMRRCNLYESSIGVKIGGRNINNLRYADDATRNMKRTWNIWSKVSRMNVNVWVYTLTSKKQRKTKKLNQFKISSFLDPRLSIVVTQDPRHQQKNCTWMKRDARNGEHLEK